LRCLPYDSRDSNVAIGSQLHSFENLWNNSSSFKIKYAAY
jgi:hypothetical protein